MENASQHIQLTAQRLVDEDALTTACFHSLEDDIIEKERRAARMHLYRYNNGVKKVLQMKEELKEECSSRLAEDSILLDTLIESQQLLQHTVRSWCTKLLLLLCCIAAYGFINFILRYRLYCNVPYCPVLQLYYTVLNCTVLYCTVQYCTVLNCTVLYCGLNILHIDLKQLLIT